MYTKVFTFGKEITSDTLYCQETGFGFIDPLHLSGRTQSEQSLYAGGWNLRSSQNSAWSSSFTTTEQGVKLQSARFVLVFKVLVPRHGSYQITLTSKAGSDGIQNMMVFCGRRNLVDRAIEVAPYKTYTKTFFTYVSPYIPAMTSIPCEEKAIYISITGNHASLSELRIEEKETPTLFIAGDSTLTDQNAQYPYYPYGSCAGWAQMLLPYFSTCAVCNQAHSGMTSNCFREDGHWDMIKPLIKKGDIVMLQFGHNDQKRRNLAAFGGYINNLRWYIKEIRAFGAYPVLLSPISRIPFMDNGKYCSLLELYALACQTAARECDVPFIDLHTLTFHQWCQLGTDAGDYFIPGDITHTNDFGANLIASYVISEIMRQQITPLSQMLCFQEKKAFLPSDDTHQLPVETSAGNMFHISIPYVDIDGIPQYSYMVEALERGLLDPCVMHLHPLEIMPRAQFLMVFFKALRIAGERPYLGDFCDISRYEWDSSYVQGCLRENLIDPLTVPNNRFRPDDALTNEEFATFCVRGMQQDREKRNLTLAYCYEEAIRLHLLEPDWQPKAPITRADCYKGLVILMDSLQTADVALPSDAELHPVG